MLPLGALRKWRLAGHETWCFRWSKGSRACSVHTFLCRPCWKTPWSLWKCTTRFSGMTDYTTLNCEIQTLSKRSPWVVYFPALWSMLNEKILSLPRRRKRRFLSNLEKGRVTNMFYAPSLTKPEWTGTFNKHNFILKWRSFWACSDRIEQ